MSTSAVQFRAAVLQSFAQLLALGEESLRALHHEYCTGGTVSAKTVQLAAKALEDPVGATLCRSAMLGGGGALTTQELRKALRVVLKALTVQELARAQKEEAAAASKRGPESGQLVSDRKAGAEAKARLQGQVSAANGKHSLKRKQTPAVPPAERKQDACTDSNALMLIDLIEGDLSLTAVADADMRRRLQQNVCRSTTDVNGHFKS